MCINKISFLLLVLRTEMDPRSRRHPVGMNDQLRISYRTTMTHLCIALHRTDKPVPDHLELYSLPMLPRSLRYDDQRTGE